MGKVRGRHGGVPGPDALALARASDQLDTTINPQLAPGVNVPVTGPQRPAFNLIRSDMWLQSINLGVEFTY